MASVPVNELKQHIGKQVELRGWLYNRRGSGKLLFLQFRDGTGLVQVVVGKADVPEPVFETARRIGNESSIIITGLVKEDTRSSLGVEVQASDLHVIQEV
ncbi:MAG: asparagine--tRNA ligase, partial [Planctomycetes bacterium]|nr:asparagine--tRNA ligase [Planctomycetota bacterium]